MEGLFLNKATVSRCPSARGTSGLIRVGSGPSEGAQPAFSRLEAERDLLQAQFGWTSAAVGGLISRQLAPLTCSHPWPQTRSPRRIRGDLGSSADTGSHSHCFWAPPWGPVPVLQGLVLVSGQGTCPRAGDVPEARRRGPWEGPAPFLCLGSGSGVWWLSPYSEGHPLCAWGCAVRVPRWSRVSGSKERHLPAVRSQAVMGRRGQWGVFSQQRIWGGGPWGRGPLQSAACRGRQGYLGSLCPQGENSWASVCSNAVD